jgi:aminoglycoside phosphotransferase (APT) family kinase protein
MAGRENASLPDEVLRFLTESRLLAAGESPAAERLSGGVSSDIWRVDLARGPICVKRALPRLRVARVWEAPVERNAYEYEWFRVAAEAAPRAVPRMLAQGGQLFAMEYLDPGRHPVWKERLRQGIAEPAFATRVGASLAAIHASTAGREDIARRFATDAIFHAIRLEPYLEAVGLLELSRRTAATRACLIHGDVSPKNILVGPQGPVFLDAECAWYGDPAFDLAFCLNHLLLKCRWTPSAAPGFLECFDALSRAYLESVSFPGVEERAAALLPGLLLARIDGKSPVEYLTSSADTEAVRRTAKALLHRKPATLSAVREAWRRSLA